MPKSSVFQKVLDFIADQSTFNVANVLIMLSSAGWLASSVAQIIGIYFNKNYTKEQKSFMIPQEFADAIVNIGSFLLVTKSFKSLSSKMVETGKIIPKSIHTFLGEKGLLSERGKFDFNVTEVEGFHKHRQTYNNFKTMVESTAAIGGGILSSNIITPILRNKIASMRKDKVLKSLSRDKQGNSVQPVQTVEQNQSNPVGSGTINTQRHSFDDFAKIAQGDVKTQNQMSPLNNNISGARLQGFNAFRTGGMTI